jgi:hypothetical protein
VVNVSYVPAVVRPGPEEYEFVAVDEFIKSVFPAPLLAVPMVAAVAIWV